MIDKRITPQVMCAACGHIFPSPLAPSAPVAESIESVEQSSAELEEVTCPECETKAVPKGVMQPSGFPSLETFKRNWNKSTSITVSTTVSKSNSSVSESLPNSSESNKE